MTFFRPFFDPSFWIDFNRFGIALWSQFSSIFSPFRSFFAPFRFLFHYLFALCFYSVFICRCLDLSKTKKTFGFTRLMRKPDCFERFPRAFFSCFLKISWRFLAALWLPKGFDVDHLFLQLFQFFCRFRLFVLFPFAHNFFSLSSSFGGAPAGTARPTRLATKGGGAKTSATAGAHTGTPMELATKAIGAEACATAAASFAASQVSAATTTFYRYISCGSFSQLLDSLPLTYFVFSDQASRTTRSSATRSLRRRRIVASPCR